MCLLSFYPPGIPVDTDELIEGITGNPDGVGFAIVSDDGKLIREHAVGEPYTLEVPSKYKPGTMFKTREMDLSECYKLAYRFAELREKYPDGPAMFHSRFATGGAEDTRGCHPFAVGNGDGTHDFDTVLAHNGVLFSPAKFEWRSDTRIFAETVLRNVLLGTHNAGIARKAKLAKCTPANLFSKNGIRKVEAYLGSNNKIAVITVNPERMTPGAKARGADWQYAIYNADQGIWTKAGAWHSNGGYMSWKSYRRGGTTYYGTGYSSVNGGDWEGERALGKWDGDADSAFLGSQYREAEATAAERSPDCQFCAARESVSVVTLICCMCQTCQDCGQLEGEGCSCFIPPSAKVPAQATPDWTPYTPTEPKAITAGDPIEKAAEAGRELLNAIGPALTESGAAYTGRLALAVSTPAGTMYEPGSNDERAAAREMFRKGELTYREFHAIVPEDCSACSCAVWCGATGCLPDDDEPMEVTVGDVVQGVVLPEEAEELTAEEAAHLSALDR